MLVVGGFRYWKLKLVALLPMTESNQGAILSGLERQKISRIGG